jgi:folate-binding protein YgfZ
MMPHQDMLVICHPDRGFLRLSGPDTVAFLQSIVTANIDTMAVGTCRASALLTPQGRVLIDMMVYRLAADHIVLQCDMARRDDLFTRLRRYRLRRPVDMAVDNTLILGHYFGETPPTAVPGTFVFTDPRDPLLGVHILADDHLCLTRLADTNHTIDGLDMAGASIDRWHVRRIAAGVPEGPVDLVPERALMLEAGLDQLGAVDFHKGCYIGQEVTARTHYRGLVKRRLVPIKVQTDIPAVGSDITLDGRIIGTSRSSAPLTGLDGSADSLCLGLLKLEDIHLIDRHVIDGASSGADAITVGGLPAQLAIPSWMRPLPNAAKGRSPA